MKPNELTGNFEFVEVERWALRLPLGELEWPMDNPEGLLELVQRETSRTHSLDLSEFPPGTARNDALYGQQRRLRFLGVILEDLTPYLPSTATGAENWLKQQD